MEDQLHTHDTIGFVAACPACDHIAMVLQAKNAEGEFGRLEVLQVKELLGV